MSSLEKYAKQQMRLTASADIMGRVTMASARIDV
jgi:hypothetical protein